MSGPTQDCVDDLIVRAHHAAVCVQDFERSRDFYVRVLGFRVEDEMDRRAEPALGEVVALPGSVIRWGMLERQGFRLELFKEAPQNPRGARLCEMRMHARRTKALLQRRLTRAKRGLSRGAAAAATKVVGPPTNRGGRRSRRRISRKPFGTGLAGALALSLSSPIAPAIGFVLLRAIIPGKQPVAPAWVLRSFLKYYTPEGRTMPGRQCDAGYTHVAFEVRDVDAAYARLIAGGHRTTSTPQVLRGGRTKVIYLLAPEGSVVELIQFLQPSHRSEVRA